MSESNQQQENSETRGCNCCLVGCVGLVRVFVSLCLFLWYSFSYHTFGENQDRAPLYSAKNGKNFSYDITYLHRYVEFEISEPDFLDWCKNSWEPVEIESLPSLPDSESNDNTMINHKRKIPLRITRYSCRKPEHKECDAQLEKCQHDPTGKTDKACFHIVDNGYYYQILHSDGGGVFVLYDRDNNRCYIHMSPH